MPPIRNGMMVGTVTGQAVRNAQQDEMDRFPVSASPGYLIEMDDEPLGVVVVENDAATFHAVHPRMFEFEGRRFRDAYEANRVVATAMRRQGLRPGT